MVEDQLVHKVENRHYKLVWDAISYVQITIVKHNKWKMSQNHMNKLNPKEKLGTRSKSIRR